MKTKIAEEAPKLASQLPQPKTYHILCAVPEVEDKYESGIVKSDQSIKYDQLLSPVMFVIELGPDAYEDKDKFPSGPSCKKGDFVIVRPNSGTRIKIHGKEFRIINDDSVEAVIDDPRGIERV